MQLSSYQESILSAVDARFALPSCDEKGILIEALAGTGKSFMLVEICRRLQHFNYSPDQVRLVVFGKKNKEDLAAKLSSIRSNWKQCVSTLHSLSYQILREGLNVNSRSFRIESSKYRTIAETLKFITHSKLINNVQEVFSGELWKEGSQELDSYFIKALELFRLYCLDATEENLAHIVKLHNLEILVSATIANAIGKCLNVGYKEAVDNYWIDYTDMSWVLWMERDNLQFALKKYRQQLKVIMVDECQDTDILQLNILSLLINPAYNYLIAVGDRHQAVYAFRGCVSDGMDRIKKQFNCESFLLPVNYRCGRSHLQLVREVFPNIPIEAVQQAEEGEVKIVKKSDFLALFDKNSSQSYIGVCRKNAPLIKTAIQLLGAGYPAKIKDRSLATKVVEQVGKICKKLKSEYSPKTFVANVNTYEALERERLLIYPDGKQKIADLKDMLEAILCLFSTYDPPSLVDWKSLIDSIFDENQNCKINLYSIHSGKGCEGDIAFIIQPETMPLSHKKQTDKESEEEKNLLYVALTRGKNILALVTSEPNEISWLPQKYYLPEPEVMSEIQPVLPEKSKPEIPEDELVDLIAKIESLPRSQQRTIVRELIDRLGKESIANLLD
ncbi:MAG: ATP-dependent helicase [Oscillatoriales cyanobacterium]|nr:MAG: ATP-dependent helicase [Oscillatoriales cyanobacterium]